jgi:peroxiredoxin
LSRRAVARVYCSADAQTQMLPADEFHGAPRVFCLITKCFYLVIRQVSACSNKNTPSWCVMARRDLHWPSTSRKEDRLRSSRFSLADDVGVGPQGEKSRPVCVQRIPGWGERRTRQPRSTHPRVILDSGCHRKAAGLADRLVGQPIPPVSFDCYQGRPVDLDTYASGFLLVLYLYPGSASSPEGGPDAQAMDAAVRWPHQLLSDTELQLASAFDLPTFKIDGVRRYHRIVLLANGGRISKAFFPISSAARCAAQVLTWMQLAAAGPPPSVCSPPDAS